MDYDAQRAFESTLRVGLVVVAYLSWSQASLAKVIKINTKSVRVKMLYNADSIGWGNTLLGDEMSIPLVPHSQFNHCHRVASPSEILAKYQDALSAYLGSEREQLCQQRVDAIQAVILSNSMVLVSQ